VMGHEVCCRAFSSWQKHTTAIVRARAWGCTRI
jgi:hypothetical protein